MIRSLLMTTLLLSFANPALAQQQIQDFTGPYDLANWTNTGMSGGTAGVDMANSTTTTGIFTYMVNLGGGGVSQRTTVFSVIAEVDGTANFDWRYDYFHAWFAVTAELTFFAYDANNVRQDLQVVNQTTNGNQTVTGQVVAMPIYAGKAFGFEVGGSNFDSNSVLNGLVTLTAFDATGLPPGPDCAGIMDGPNRLDRCGVCDANPANDCVQDCAGDWGGTAAVDMCNTCDEDPSNDCEQDCAGDWGGTATLDGCGTCDEDPLNDCEQDCNGVWGGPSQLDNCGECDLDPSNDCVRDCNLEWGGTAAVDLCGVCSGGTTGIAVDACVDEINDPPPSTGCDCSVPTRSGAGTWAWVLFPLVFVAGRRGRS